MEGINSKQSHHSQVISAQLVRPCGNRDFHNPLPQLVTFPLLSPLLVRISTYLDIQHLVLDM